MRDQVGTDNRGVVRVLKFVGGKPDELERADFVDVTLLPPPPKHSANTSPNGSNKVVRDERRRANHNEG